MLSDDLERFKLLRKKMVEEQIAARGVRDKRVLDVMEKVPRHLFIEKSFRDKAYGDHPLPIGENQTISQPYMVALMTELLELQGTEKVLEIGTGSGYQSAVLSRLANSVTTIERIQSLSESAHITLDSLGMSNVNFKVLDGTLGWKKEAPFDAIIVTAGSPDIPECYLRQLSQGGRLVIPIGDEFSQTLYRFRKTGKDIKKERITGCVFVRLIGKHGWKKA